MAVCSNADQMKRYLIFFIVVNDNFEAALNELDAIVTTRRLRKEKQIIRHQQLFENSGQL